MLTYRSWSRCTRFGMLVGGLSLSSACVLPWYVLHFAKNEGVVGIREYILAIPLAACGLLVGLLGALGPAAFQSRERRMTVTVTCLGSMVLAFCACWKVLSDIRGINEDLIDFSLATAGPGLYLLASGGVLSGISGWLVLHPPAPGTALR